MTIFFFSPDGLVIAFLKLIDRSAYESFSFEMQ
jgi:hypothetical protein